MVIARAQFEGRNFVIDKLPNQIFGAYVVQERDDEDRPIGSQMSFDSVEAAKQHALEITGVPANVWKQ